ncbi:MAG: polysaccharide biosynthesis tyrosine autokinase, partial [Anaerolineales bacterium]|nr:polysaccharide biosynthesis tyrosine autokinase [Anaerolineales bacterium]
MELLQYIEILKRRFWVIVVTAIVSVAIVGVGSYLITPVYSASAVVRITQIQDGGVSYYDLNYSERLMNTYSHLLESRPFLEEVIQRLQVNITSVELANSIKIEPLANTELIQITVENTNPGMAMGIANTLGDLLVEQRENLYTGQGRSVREILQDQLAVVEENLAADRANLQKLLNRGADLAQGGIAQDLSSRIQVQEQTYAMLLNEYERAQIAEAARASSISVVEPAIIPEEPIKPRNILNITLGALVGLVGGMGLAFLFENLDLAIYTVDKLEAATKLPLLGSIPHLDLPRKPSHRAVLLRGNRQSPPREAFRILRTNVNALMIDIAAKTLLIASAEQGAGKSTILANLAVSMAQAGRKVVMVDSDLRHPYLHVLFGISNDWGLITMITRPSRVSSSTQLAKTKFPGVSLLTSGPLPPNPGERVGSIQMRKLIAELRLEADMVLLDSPPILNFADGAALASMVDGVVLVAARGEA